MKQSKGNVIDLDIARMDRELAANLRLREYRGYRAALYLQDEKWFHGRVQALSTGPDCIITFSGNGEGFEVYDAAVRTAVDTIHARGVPQVPAGASVPSVGDRQTSWSFFRYPDTYWRWLRNRHQRPR